MNRRDFLCAAIVAGLNGKVLLLTPSRALAEPATGLVTESTYFQRIRHFHNFVIPLEALQNPPANGYEARTSHPIREKTDEELYRIGLGYHSHKVQLSQVQLSEIASGREVVLEVLNPEGKLAHRFFFRANEEILNQLV